MLYLIGLGLNIDGISTYGLEIAKRCKRIYVESYTVDFPYEFSELQELIKKKVIPADRKFVESLEIIDEAQKMDVALLIYGSPLTATTHITLLQEAKASKIKYKVIYNASILDAIAETGLQLYKFGKIASMPTWKRSFTPDSFMKVVKDNQLIDAHSLILIDIDLDFEDALDQLNVASNKQKVSFKKIIVCQSLGTKHKKIYYGTPEELKEVLGVRKPYCIIIPSKLHFVEEEVLQELRGK